MGQGPVSHGTLEKQALDSAGPGRALTAHSVSWGQPPAVTAVTAVTWVEFPQAESRHRTASIWLGQGGKLMFAVTCAHKGESSVFNPLSLSEPKGPTRRPRCTVQEWEEDV